MSRPDPGTYTIHPKDVPGQGFLIGPVPRIFPPPDVPLRVGNASDEWILRNSNDNTFTVFAGKGNPGDYKWIVKNNTDLFVSSVSPPDNFRFESAGSDDAGRLFTIGLFGQDALLTLGDVDAVPRLTFRPANGSSAQRFRLAPVTRIEA